MGSHEKASTLPTDTVDCAATIAQKPRLRANAPHGTSCRRSGRAGLAAAAAAPPACPAGSTSSLTIGCQKSSQKKPREPKPRKMDSQPSWLQGGGGGGLGRRSRANWGIEER